MLREQINKLKNEVELATKKIPTLLNEYVDIDIDEKFEVYLEVEDLLPIHNFVKDLPSLSVGDVVGYDNIVHAEKYMPVLYSYIVECLVEAFHYEFEEYGTISPTIIKLVYKGAKLLRTELSEDDSNALECFEAYIKQLEKEIIESGFGGFYYDW